MASTPNPGDVEYSALSSLLTSNLALGIGVAVAAYGTYLWLVKQNAKAGFTLIIASALIALTTGMLDGLKAQFCPAVTMLGGTCGTSAYGTGAGGLATFASSPASITPGGSDATIGTDGKAVVTPGTDATTGSFGLTGVTTKN